MASRSPRAGFMALMSPFGGRKNQEREADQGKSSHDTSSPNPERWAFSREYQVQLQNLWLDGMKRAKEAVEIYVNSLQDLQRSRSEQEMVKVVTDAGDILKASVERLIDEQTASANLFIQGLPPGQQDAAIGYWSSQTSHLRYYSQAAMKCCGESIKQLTDLTMKLWKVNVALAENIDGVYQRTVSNVI
jgi:hypothetical protein